MGKPLALKVGVEPTPTTYRDTDRLPPEDLRILPDYSRQSPAIYHLVKSRAILGYSVLHNPRLFLKLHLTRKPVLVPIRSCSTSANGHLVSCYVSIWSRTGKHYLGVRQSCRLFPAIFTYAAMSIMNLVKAFNSRFSIGSLLSGRRRALASPCYPSLALRASAAFNATTVTFICYLLHIRFWFCVYCICIITQHSVLNRRCWILNPD